MRSFKDGFKRARKRAGYTQKSFAEAFVASIDSVKNWEQGRNKPELPTIERLCDFFKCDIAYLFNEIECETHDIQFICEYTGLSQEAVKVLHYLSRNNPPGTVSNIPEYNKLNVNFINRVLKSVHYSSLKIDDKELSPVGTVFSFMEQYVTSGTANRLLSPEEERMNESETGSLEGFNRYEKRLSKASRYITIGTADGNSLAMLTVGELYREHLFREIRNCLDFYEKAEQNGNKWIDKDSKKK